MIVTITTRIPNFVNGFIIYNHGYRSLRILILNKNETLFLIKRDYHLDLRNWYT